MKITRSKLEVLLSFVLCFTMLFSMAVPAFATDGENTDPQPEETCQHVYGEEVVTVKAATCTEDGSGTKTCTVENCGHEETVVLPKLGHSKGENEVTVISPATCAAAGKQSYTCASCSETVEEEIPATGEHSYEATTTAATCGAAGKTVYTCSVCFGSYEEPIPATGEHSYGEDHKCSVCGADEPVLKNSTPTCTCTVKCAEGAVNTECTVCSAEGADLSACLGCSCTEKCVPGDAEAGCPVCESASTFENCVGAVPTPDCTCTLKCTAAPAASICEACAAAVGNCTGAEASGALSFAQFNELLYKNNGVVSGVSVVLKDSERSYQNNQTAQFFLAASTWDDVNALASISVSGVNFTFEDDVADNYTSGELQVFANSMSFTGCTFNGTAVSPWGAAHTGADCVSASFSGCIFNNLSGRYGIHQNMADTLSVTDCQFNNCERGIHTNSPTPVSITITGNRFTGIGEGYGALCLAENGNYTEAALNITRNNAENQVFLRQLNATATYDQVQAILDTENNTYGTAYVNGSIEPAKPVARINGVGYADLQKAIDAAYAAGGEVTINITENVSGSYTVTEKVGLYLTIDGGDNTLTGKITIKALSDANDNRRTTIQNINFVDDGANVDFISSNETNHYPRITVSGCSFTGNGNGTDVAIRLKSSYGAVIENCTGTGLHSFLQNNSGHNMTIDNVTVSNSKSGLALGTVQGVTVSDCNISASDEGYGIRIDANTYNNNAVISDNTVSAYIPVVVRGVNTASNITVSGTNTMTASNNDGKWLVIGATEYGPGVALPNDAAGNVGVMLKDSGLSYTGVHGNYVEASIGTVRYPSLAAAVADSQTGDIVKLEKDITLSSMLTIPADKSLSLDLNGKTIDVATQENGNHIYAIDNLGTLTLTGTGTINARGVQNKGSMTINSADLTINALDSNGGACVWSEKGDLYISAGTFNAPYGQAGCVRADQVLEITGGTFTSEGGDANNFVYAIIFNGSYGSISNAAVKGSHGAVSVLGGGAMTISSGEFSCTGIAGMSDHCIYVNDAQLTITGGSFTGDNENGGVALYAETDSVVSVSGGEFHNSTGAPVAGAGEVAITGGTYDVKPADKYIAEDFEAKENTDGKFDVAKMLSVAAIGSTEYTSFEKAAAAAQSTAGQQTIVLLTDVDITGAAVNLSDDVLDLNGKKLTGVFYGTLSVNKGQYDTVVGPANTTYISEDAVITFAEDATTFVSGSLSLNGCLTDSVDGTTTVGKDASLTILKSSEFAVNGSLIVENGGTLINNGSLRLSNAAATITAPAGLGIESGVTGYVVVHDGTKYSLAAASAVVATVDGTNFTSLQAAVNAADEGDTVTVKSSSTEEVTVNKSITLQLEDNVTVKAVKVTGAAALSISAEDLENITDGVSLANASVKAGDSTVSIMEGTVTAKDGSLTATPASGFPVMVNNIGVAPVNNAPVAISSAGVTTVPAGSIVAFDKYAVTAANGGSISAKGVLTQTPTVLEDAGYAYAIITEFDDKGNATYTGVLVPVNPESGDAYKLMVQLNAKGELEVSTDAKEEPILDDKADFKGYLKFIDWTGNPRTPSFYKHGFGSLKFEVNGFYSAFDKVFVDGKELKTTDCNVTQGSTIVTLKNSYLKNLALGNHTLKVTYADGQSVSMTFSIVNTPITGDNSNVILFASLMAFSGIAAAALLFVLKRKNRA